MNVNKTSYKTVVRKLDIWKCNYLLLPVETKKLTLWNFWSLETEMTFSVDLHCHRKMHFHGPIHTCNRKKMTQLSVWHVSVFWPLLSKSCNVNKAQPILQTINFSETSQSVLLILIIIIFHQEQIANTLQFKYYFYSDM